MTTEEILIIIFVPIIIALIVFLVIYFRNPFHFPYTYIDFDITSKKQPSIEDYIDQYLINNGLLEIEDTINYLTKWKSYCENRINKSIFKKKRKKQYLNILDDNGLFIFRFYRMQTRYRQYQYQKYSYKVKVFIDKFKTNFNYINKRYLFLKKINFECTISEYNKRDQRKLMTKELRNQIAERDNYTCQKCGKYMPDSIGLHIDHIIPISKGGKSIPSNLQVLCSKCNGSKSSKI